VAGNASTIKIEIAVDDKGGVKVIRQIGSESEKTGKKGKKSFSGMGKSLGSMNKRLAVAAGKIAALAAAAISIGTLIIAVRKLKKAVEEYVSLANIQEKVETRLAAVVRSTGGAAGFSAGELYEMAAAMQKVTTIGDEVTIGGMAILATFKQIRGEAFERTTMAAADMADVMESDLKSALVMIGKALNDPIANLSAMSRAGVQFTNIQKETIKRLWELGDAAGAQSIILDELESQFGGAAEAARERFGGSVTAAKNALGDYREELGYVITKNQFFIDLAHLAEERFIAWGNAVKENRVELMLLAKEGVLKVVDSLTTALEVMRFFHNGWLGIKLAGQTALWGLVTLLDKVYSRMRFVLKPMDLIFAGAKKIGLIDVNPFDKIGQVLGDLREITWDGTKGILGDIEKNNKRYDTVIDKIRTLRAEIAKIEVSQAADEKGRVPGVPTEEEAAKAVKAARETALAVAQADKEILEGRLSEYQNFYGKLQTMIQQTAEQEKAHVRELNQLYKQKADIRMSTEAMIRSLRESRMTPEEKYESQRSGLSKQYLEALKLSGQEQVQALEAYKAAVQGLASQFSGGISAGESMYGMGGERFAVSSKEIIETAISDIQRAAGVQQRALQDLAVEKERQVEADRVWKDELVRSAKDVAIEIEMLEGVLTELSAMIDEMDRVIKIEGEDRVTPVVNQIQTALNGLHDKTVTITTIHRDVFAGVSGGGESAAPVEGSHASGTRWVPKTGLYVLHQGEEVHTPSEVKREDAGSGITIKGDINVIIPESAAPQKPEDYRMITRQYIIPELQRAGRL